MAFSRNRGAGPAKGTLEYFEAQSRSTRITWIIVLALTLVNTLMMMFSDSGTVFLFSSWLPLDQGVGAMLLYGYGMEFTMPLVIAIVAFVVMILAAILWNKSTVWPLIALLSYVVDCAYIAGSLLSENFGYLYLTDIASGMIIFHIVGLVYLVFGYINALKAVKARKAAAEAPVFATEAAPAESENEVNQYKGPEL